MLRQTDLRGHREGGGVDDRPSQGQLWDWNRSNGEKDKAITRDPLCRKANADLDLLGKEYGDHVLGVLDPARATLRQNTMAFERAIQEFEAFVAAKERGWFTSKKSVPAARQAITKSRQCLDTLKTLQQFSA